MFRSTLFASTALLSSLPLSAQVDDTPVDQVPGEIVVTASLPQTPGTPAYARIELEREDVISTPSGTVEGALSLVAGLQQFRRSDSRSSNPSAQGVTLRALGGNATSRALVLLDGVPVADPFFGYIPFTALAPERIGSIAVTRGGGSGPFGAGALAGTIEIESADPAALDPVLASALVNDRGETQIAGVGTARLGTGFVSAGARWDRGQGFFTTPRDQRVPATARAAYDNWSLDLRGGAPVGEGMSLQARMMAFDDRRTLRFDGANSRSRGQDASLRFVGRGEWQFDALAYVQARNFANIVISSTRFTRVLDQRNTPSTGVGGKLELRPPVGPSHTLRVGVDYRRAEGELQEDAYSAFSGNVTQRRRAGGVTEDMGVFVEDDWTIGSLVLTGGVRLDRTRIAEGFFESRDPQGNLVERLDARDRTDWTLTYRGGALFDLAETVRLRAALYSGLRLPTLNELYRPFVVFPVVTQANAELDNERLKGFEAGIDWRPADGVRVSVTGFDNRVENAIANVTLAPNLRQRRNLPAIEARGIEASVSAGSGGFDAIVTASYTDATIEGRNESADLDGNRPPQVPTFSAAGQITYIGAAGWSLGARIEHVGAQFESDQETDRLPPATTFGLVADWPVSESLSAIVRAENLLNERIVTRNSGGSIDLGIPRTIWAGVLYGF